MKNAAFTLIALCAVSSVWAVESLPTGDMSEGVAFNPVTRMLVTTNMGTGTLTLIDLDARQVARTIDVGGTPAGPAIDTRNNTVVYSDKADGTMVIWSLDEGGGELARLPVGANPICVGLNEKANVAVAASADEATVAVVDLGTRTVTRKIGVDAFPLCMHYTINPEDMTAIVASGAEGTLQLLDLTEGTVLNTIPVGNFPVGPSRNLVTNQAIVPLHQDGAAAIVDLNTGTVTHTVPLGAGAVCSIHDEARNMAFVTSNVEHSISAVDMASGSVLGTFGPIGSEPQCLAYDAAMDVVMVTAHSGEVWLVQSSEIIGAEYSPPTAVEANSWGEVKRRLCCPVPETTEAADAAPKPAPDDSGEGGYDTHH